MNYVEVVAKLQKQLLENGYSDTGNDIFYNPEEELMFMFVDWNKTIVMAEKNYSAEIDEETLLSSNNDHTPLYFKLKVLYTLEKHPVLKEKVMEWWTRFQN